jgi:prevent-host-death family protein
MERAGIRELKQNASAVVSAAAAGRSVVITDRGRPVAQLSPIAGTELQRMRAAGLVRDATRRLADLSDPEPAGADETSPSDALEAMRDDER